MGRTRTIGKVGLLSTKEHNAPYVKVLTGLGFRVVQLDGHCTSIPNSIKFCLVKVDCVSHATTDTALAWVRRSPSTRSLAFISGVRDAKARGEEYKAALLAEEGPTTSQTIEELKKRVKRRRTVNVPRKPEKKVEDPLSAKERFVLETIRAAKTTGIGMHDLVAAWTERWSSVSRSTVNSRVGALIKKGLVVNLGGSGRSSTGTLRAAWYIGYTEAHGLSEREAKLRPGTKTRIAYEAHLKRFRGQSETPKMPKLEKIQRNVPVEDIIKQEEVPMKVVAIPPLRKDPDTPMDSIKSECELLVMWMREWNVKSIAISDKGIVELASAPTKSPELSVTFRYDKS